ncbi:GNAT family N-acetyltransferase [Actinomadura barringtoniae]|uniref:GNAT family N-acetyltransferase n=1 Tax=Actinomadura barringtoniae TaxID=1427535 RepID=A0A939PF49_9ACTN|nr:GNAT family N-acetyltransferase [Actinomadura barringtoniae]
MALLLGQLGYPAEEREVAERIGEWRDCALSCVLVAVDEGVAGVVALHAVPFFERAGRRGRVVCLVVDERVRGSGLGGRLLRAAEGDAERLGCVEVELTSARERVEAHGFYGRMGYRDRCGESARFLRLL